MQKILVFSLLFLSLSVISIPLSFAESDYSKIKLKDVTTQIIEFDNYKIIRTSLTIENNDTEKLYYFYKYLTADGNIHYEKSSASDIDEVGDKTCPRGHIEIGPGLEKDYTLCFQVPKSFPNNFELKFMNDSSERCKERTSAASDNPYITLCKEKSYPLSLISNTTQISYESLLKTYVQDFENMNANISNMELVAGDYSDLLITTLSVFNGGNTAIDGYSIDVAIRNIAGLEFETSDYWDWDCGYGIDDINPGLTKTARLCFEIPKNETNFDVILRSDFGYDGLSDCDNDSRDCTELVINIIAPAPTSDVSPSNTPIELIEMDYLKDLGISESSAHDDQIIITPLTNLKKFVNNEKEFSIQYPASLSVEEGYIGGHGTEGKVRFTDDVNGLVYLSVFGRIDTSIDSEYEIFKKQELMIPSYYPDSFQEITKQYVLEANGHKHHITEFIKIDDSNIFPINYRDIISWVIVDDELWEINTYQNITPIHFSLRVAYDSILDESTINNMANTIMNSSASVLIDLITSFEKTTSFSNTPQESLEPTGIPAWIKNNAGWWADGAIDDNSFIQGIQYLIKEGIMEIPPTTTQGSSSGTNEIPSWIKNNAGWWADGAIDDNSFIQGIQFLVEKRILNVD